MRTGARRYNVHEVFHKKDPDPVAFGQERPRITTLIKELLPEPCSTAGMTLG